MSADRLADDFVGLHPGVPGAQDARVSADHLADDFVGAAQVTADKFLQMCQQITWPTTSSAQSTGEPSGRAQRVSRSLGRRLRRLIAISINPSSFLVSADRLADDFVGIAISINSSSFLVSADRLADDFVGVKRATGE